ncbi:hypothetical protein AX14_003338 [Amanita brunnescens Koide BX004]|nr:hypothetical protein AX14_003338 [Amanita brunnescens Koide BX004]
MRREDETSDLIDNIIASHGRLRADLFSQTALFTEMLSEQLATQTAVLSAMLAEKVAQQTAQLNATLDHHLSRLNQMSRSQSDSFIALMRHFKESHRETLKSREMSKSRSSSIDSECPHGCFPTQTSLEQEKVLSKQALGKQQLVMPRPSLSEQVMEEGVHHLTDEQINKGLLKLVGPADLETLIVLCCNETV